MSKRRRKPVKGGAKASRASGVWIGIGVLAIAVLVVFGSRAMRSTPPANEPLASAPFSPTIENRTPPPGPAPEGMVWIPGGEFSMGASDPPDMNDRSACRPRRDSRPVHRVYVNGFWMDATEVTNEQFAGFVKATGYVTVAERTPRPEDFPGRAAGESRRRVGGLHAARPCGAARRPFPVVGVREGRELAASRRTGQLDRGQGAVSRRAHRLRGCRGLCQVGRQAAADRGGMGVRRARRPDRQDLSLG